MSYTTFRAVSAYLLREARGNELTYVETHPVGDPSILIAGQRWQSGPVCTERFFCEQEPAILDRVTKRLVMWQTSVERPQPKGWWRFPLPCGVTRTGYAEIEDSEHYWKRWIKDARRLHARWSQQTEYESRDATLEEYAAGFAAARPNFRLRPICIEMLRKKEECHPGLVRYRCIWHRGHPLPLGGSGTLDIPEAQASFLISTYFHPAHARSNIGTGIIDDWFRQSVTRGLRYMDFDLFWRFGEPFSWRGFSRFKAQFGTRIIDYPRPFMRIVGF